MPITTPTQTVSATSTSGTGLFTVASTQSGSLLTLGFSYLGVATITSVSDNQGNTWVARAPSTHVDTVGGIFYDVVGAIAGVTTVKVIMSSGEVTGIFQEYSAVSSFDKDANAIGTSASPNSGATATLTGTNDLVIGWVAINSGLGTASGGVGFGNVSIKDGTSYSFAVENLQAGSNAAQTATFTIGSSKWVCGVVAYQISSSGNQSFFNLLGIQ